MRKTFVLLTVFVFTAFFAGLFVSCGGSKKVVLVDNDEILELINNRDKNIKVKNFVFEKNNSKNRSVSAVITCKKQFAFDENQESFSELNQLVYPLNSKRELYVPVIESDFSIAKSKQKTVIDPDLDVQILSIEKIPQKYRALPVGKNYAGQKNYALTKNVSAVVTVCDERERNALKEILDQIFAFEKEDSKQTVNFVTGVGDLMVGRGVEDVLINESQGPKSVFTDTLSLLQNSDITIGNLEGAVTNYKTALHKTYTFKFNKKVLKPLKEAGFNYFMFTNNHCYDYGETGFKDTLEAFKEYQCATSGVGENITEARKFYHTNINGQNFAIISMGAFPVEVSGFNGLTMASATDTRAGMLWQNDDVLKDIASEKAKGNIVIVNVHGGREYYLSPVKEQREYYEKLVDSGASIVFGSHPHVIQPTEWYKNGLIVYSLGNFVFNGMNDMPNATDTEIVKVGFYNDKIVYTEQYPCKIEGKTVRRK